MHYRRTIITILLCCAWSGAASLDQDELKKHQSELQTIRKQIQEYEQKIRQQSSKEKATLELLDSYDRKATLVRRLITKLRSAESALQDTIGVTRYTMQQLDAQLKFLKHHYAGYVKAVYTSGRVRDLELLLSARSINQLYIRSYYLRRFTDQRKRDAEKIDVKRGEVESVQYRLQTQLAEERRLIAEKGAEEDRLVSLSSDRKRVLADIRKDKSSTQKEIERKRKAAQELENVIASLIEADRLKKEKRDADVKEGKFVQPPPVSGNFASKKGKLRWPVAEGVVVAKFGNQVHPRLKTVTMNTGIDIQVKAGSSVTTVADGEISTILWYPSYGNLLIINHYNGFRTVYTHLAEILVAEGQKVKEGDRIGTSGEAIDGPRLHFELWKEREKQNPELWLSR
ncbi:MAG: peptidoglycan DD-metalloendopeptidase family protein [Ignavibacteriae bacterium]|nr:peptidoglycan DD-metalloendopeptidase family protein [Ignavibacteriota bacterium]